MLELLTPAQMAHADRLTIKSGVAGIELMENAGTAVADRAIEAFADAKRFLVVCGTGNNGGDGFVAANVLNTKKKDARVWITGDITRVGGDAELALAGVDPSMLLQDRPDFKEFDVIIDGLLGAGLDRDVNEPLASLISDLNQCGKPIMAIDLPSGVDGATGAIRGVAISAEITVTFFRKKPGHFLLPGRQCCGSVHVEQIGIESRVLEKSGFAGLINRRELWFHTFPMPSPSGHKYHRGHTLVVSGPSTRTGAARLAAGAALRSGSGLVTLASPRDALLENACHLTSVMLLAADTGEELLNILSDERFNSVGAGPGMPEDGNTRLIIKSLVSSGRNIVIDAGGLVAFEKNPSELFNAMKSSESQCVLTPHEGEFARLFPYENCTPSKFDRALQAAKSSGATIILKGPDTVIANPDGRVAVTGDLPPWLATAGSGDVLTGIAAGLLAQGMPAFEAGCAAVWIHGEAARLCGPGMISSDLDQSVKEVIALLIKDAPA